MGKLPKEQTRKSYRIAKDLADSLERLAKAHGVTETMVIESLIPPPALADVIIEFREHESTKSVFGDLWFVTFQTIVVHYLMEWLQHHPDHPVSFEQVNTCKTVDDLWRLLLIWRRCNDDSEPGYKILKTKVRTNGSEKSVDWFCETEDVTKKLLNINKTSADLLKRIFDEEGRPLTEIPVIEETEAD